MSSLGVVRLAEMLAKRDCLAVVNYHRIGDKNAEPFDELVYSATASDFEQQVRYLAKRFRIVALEEALESLTGKRPLRGPTVLITFDDGYLDNYRIAFPILRSLRAPATFFLISSYLRNPIIPWWDKIAYLVRNSGRTNITLSYPQSVNFPLPTGRRAGVIRQVVDLYKSSATTEPETFMQELENACAPVPAVPTDARLFINVEEAREMIQGGMQIGSHTRTHRILAKLPREEQASEILGSQDELCRDLGVPIEAIAYPVGSHTAFSETTVSILQSSTYRAAFSFYGGVNQCPAPRPFDVTRFGVDSTDTMQRFEVKVTGAILSNGYVF